MEWITICHIQNSLTEINKTEKSIYVTSRTYDAAPILLKLKFFNGHRFCLGFPQNNQRLQI